VPEKTKSPKEVIRGMSVRSLSTDFDPAFLASKGHLAERWKRLDRTMRRFGELTPVSLYRIGEDYFAVDGNHRVSVETLHQRSRRKT
jgi:hypothetical protein